MPHTVTNWITNTLCVSQTLGVALAETTEITAYQPFFLDVLTPYSMKRGETSYLQVILFNYLNYNLPVSAIFIKNIAIQFFFVIDSRNIGRFRWI